MADAYYRSLYFSLNSPDDLELLGLLLALPRWRQPSAIKSALKQHLPSILDSPALSAEEVRAIVGGPARPRRRRRALTEPLAPSRPSSTPRNVVAGESPAPDAEVPRAADVSDLPTAERVLEKRLGELMNSRWIG